MDTIVRVIPNVPVTFHDDTSAASARLISRVISDHRLPAGTHAARGAAAPALA
jgi:hypothetical protein